MRTRIAIGVVVFAGVACAIVASYRSWEKAPPASPPPNPPHTQLSGVDLGEWVDGKKLWALRSGRVVYDAERHQAILHGIEATFLEGARVVSIARSPSATLETETRRVRMDGGIRIESRVEDSDVYADCIDWQGGNQLLHAAGNVAFRRGKNVVRGQELWADRALRRVSMGGPARARFYLERP